MKTFIELRDLGKETHFKEQRKNNLAELSDDVLDSPIVGLINDFNRMPFCFTLQSCCGHFTHSTQKDSHNLEPLPRTGSITQVEYRIAYVAFCIENSESGKEFLSALKGIPDIDPANIQFGCAEWFWNNRTNSYVLQVEPDRYKNQDTAVLNYQEALHIEKVRDQFFIELRDLWQKYRQK